MSGTMCKFFIQGNCRYGSSCRFSHSTSDMTSPFNRYSDPNRFTYLNPDEKLKQKMKQKVGSVDTVADTIQNDFKSWLSSKVWPFSCYSVGSMDNIFPELQDLSTEEARFAYVTAQKSGSLDKHNQEIVQQFLKVQEFIMNVSKASKDDILVLLRQKGGTENESPNMGSNVFTNSSTSVFGSASNPFTKNSGTNAFGGQSSFNNNNSSGLGSNSGVFGSNSATSFDPLASSNTFGSSNTSGSIFGNNNSSSNMFGNNSNATIGSITTNSSNPFGATANNPSSVFGPTPSTSNVFGGSSNTQTSNNVFGSSSGFGASNSSTNIFLSNNTNPNPFLSAANTGNQSNTRSAFGQSNPSNNSSVFGQSAFGQTGFSKPGFGQPAFQSANSNQTSGFGNQSTFGQSSTNSTHLPFSQTNTTSGFNQANLPNQSAFSQPGQSAFGQPAFGQTPAPGCTTLTNQIPANPTNSTPFSNPPASANIPSSADSTSSNPFTNQSTALAPSTAPSAAPSSAYSEDLSRIPKLTEEDIIQYKKPFFEFGKIPECPPPLELCV